MTSPIAGLTFADLARVTTATTGTGTLTLGAAVSGFLTFSGAGITSGQSVPYAISDGANSETGWGVVTNSAGTWTLTRNVLQSTNGGAPISLSGSAQVMIAPTAFAANAAQSANRNLTLHAPTTTQFSDKTLYSGTASNVVWTDDAVNGLVMSATGAARVCSLRNIPGSPSSFSVAGRFMLTGNDNGCAVGLVFVDGSNKYYKAELGQVASNLVQGLWVNYGSSLASPNNIAYNIYMNGHGWIKIAFDATNCYAYLSTDGYNWALQFTNTLSSMSLGTPARYGIAADFNSAVEMARCTWLYSDESGFSAPAIALIV